MITIAQRSGMFMKLGGLLVLAALCPAFPVGAATLVTLVDARFEDGTSFDFSATINDGFTAFTDWSITTHAGTAKALALNPVRFDTVAVPGFHLDASNSAFSYSTASSTYLAFSISDPTFAHGDRFSFSVNSFTPGDWTRATVVENNEPYRTEYSSFGVTRSASLAINLALIGGAVPEPASWTLMVSGFGLVGGAMRRHARVSFA